MGKGKWGKKNANLFGDTEKEKESCTRIFRN